MTNPSAVSLSFRWFHSLLRCQSFSGEDENQRARPCSSIAYTPGPFFGHVLVIWELAESHPPSDQERQFFRALWPNIYFRTSKLIVLRLLFFVYRLHYLFTLLRSLSSKTCSSKSALWYSASIFLRKEFSAIPHANLSTSRPIRFA